MNLMKRSIFLLLEIEITMRLQVRAFLGMLAWRDLFIIEISYIWIKYCSKAHTLSLPELVRIMSLMWSVPTKSYLGLLFISWFIFYLNFEILLQIALLDLMANCCEFQYRTTNSHCRTSHFYPKTGSYTPFTSSSSLSLNLRQSRFEALVWWFRRCAAEAFW